MSDNPTGRILDGKKVATAIREDVAERAAAFEAQVGRKAGLAAVLVGDDPASQVYVSSKERAAEESGLHGRAIRLPAATSQEEVLELLESLNADETVDGILVQLPLPDHLEGWAVIGRLDPAKDVDGFHPANVGRLHLGLPTCAPCTPAGVMEALRREGVELRGAQAVIVGRSNIVGKPMGALLLASHATVTTCHSRTRDLPGTCRRADVLVVAIGRPGIIGADAVKPGATVIDVGINRLESPRDDEVALRMLGEGTKRHERYRERGHALVGDVDYRAARAVAGLITPVPGGVGPLTIAMLLSNTVDAAARRAGVTLT